MRRVLIAEDEARIATFLAQGLSSAGFKTYVVGDGQRALAEAFCRHPDDILSREQLLSQVWGYDFDPGSNVVDVYVRYLRRKIGADRIETVRGAGYRLISA